MLRLDSKEKTESLTMTQQAYTDIDAVDKILAEAEEILLESVGRYQAQRFIGMFASLVGMSERHGRNFWKEIYEAGQNSISKKET